MMDRWDVNWRTNAKPGEETLYLFRADDGEVVLYKDHKKEIERLRKLAKEMLTILTGCDFVSLDKLEKWMEELKEK